MAQPLPVIDIEDIKKLENYADTTELLQKVGITPVTTLTVIPTRCTNFPITLIKWFLKLQEANTRREKSAIMAEMIETCVRPCNPIKAQLMYLSKKFVEGSLKFMTDDVDTIALATTIDSFKSKMRKVTAAELLNYEKSVEGYRKWMNDSGYIYDESRWHDGNVRAELKVGHNALSLMHMIARMRPWMGDTITGFHAHKMDIDPVWLAFFTAVHYAKISINEFYDWQSGIYCICQNIREEREIMRIMNNLIAAGIPGYNEMRVKASSVTDIDLPPWIFTPGRIYDIAAVIGPCDAKNVETTIAKPAISWRYFLSLDFGKKDEFLSLLICM